MVTRRPLADTLTGEETAKALAALIETLPDGIELAFFLIADKGQKFESVLASTVPPDAVAIVLVEWLRRHAAGETTPGPASH